MNDSHRADDETEVRRHQSFVQLQNTCPLCQTALTIKVESYLENFTLREEASCPKCQLPARVKDHTIN